jgi:antitoxin component YwqK of YwqJK toxin-antitoxin module
MKTKIISFSILMTGLLSCSNQTPEKQEEVKVEAPVNQDSTRFTIATEQQDSVVNTGESIQKYKNGVIRMRGMMKDGKREGLWKSWYENGTPWSETTFAAGVRDGKTVTWYENGNKRYEGAYTNDMESGKWTYWDEKGKEAITKDYGNK